VGRIRPHVRAPTPVHNVPATREECRGGAQPLRHANTRLAVSGIRSARRGAADLSRTTPVSRRDLSGRLGASRRRAVGDRPRPGGMALVAATRCRRGAVGGGDARREMDRGRRRRGAGLRQPATPATHHRPQRRPASRRDTPDRANPRDDACADRVRPWTTAAAHRRRPAHRRADATSESSAKQ
jgi:hypothetical protein